MRGDDEFVTLQRHVADLETELRQSQQAERAARQRADLLEQSARTAWRLSVAAPRPRDGGIPE
jgi:hypothetical protein